MDREQKAQNLIDNEIKRINADFKNRQIILINNIILIIHNMILKIINNIYDI